ncbi:hypothetical protein [Bernardetia sp.]|uniref:hypothetical protein n=1 Tax=Bernardetia sp. TaxID=1937974 RepID=UPI0025C2387D|nr:hypothetical protein [Bernardetia sp.]
MLKLTQNSSEILELSINYAKNFLVVAFFVALAFMVVLAFAYEHISLEANLSKDTLKTSHFRFFSGFKTKEFRLSSIRKIDLGSSSSKMRSQKYNYENPILILNNGEQIKLLSGKRQVGFSSSFTEEFNRFLQQRNQTSFKTTERYFGVLSAIILIPTGIVILILLALGFFVGNTNYIFDKNKNQYFVKYSSPLKQNKQGNLSEIKNILLLKKVEHPTFDYQAGLHLELSNHKTIMIITSAELSSNPPTEKAIRLKQNAEKMAHFLNVEVKQK